MNPQFSCCLLSLPYFPFPGAVLVVLPYFIPAAVPKEWPSCPLSGSNTVGSEIFSMNWKGGEKIKKSMPSAPWHAFQLLAFPRFRAQTYGMILMKMYRARVSVSAVPAGIIRYPQVISSDTELLLPLLPGSGQKIWAVVMGMLRVSTSMPAGPGELQMCGEAFPGIFLSHSSIHTGTKWPKYRVLFLTALLRKMWEL